MILNDTEIDGLSRGTSLIVPYATQNLRRASYDLSVGSEFCVFDGVEGFAAKSSVVRHESLLAGQSFEVPPNAVSFIACSEKIRLPSDIAARVSLRMSYIYKGMIVASQPPFDPGYEVMVVVMVHNLSSKPLVMKQGERFVTIEFQKTSGPFQATTSPSKNVHTFHQPLNGKITTSLQGLEGGFRSLERRVNGLFTQLGGLVAVIIAIPAISAFVSFSALSSKIDDQQREIERLKVISEGLRIGLQAAPLAAATSSRVATPMSPAVTSSAPASTR